MDRRRYLAYPASLAYLALSGLLGLGGQSLGRAQNAPLQLRLKLDRAAVDGCSYRFVAPDGRASEPAAVPRPGADGSIVLVPPAEYLRQGVHLEIRNQARRRIAHLPVVPALPRTANPVENGNFTRRRPGRASGAGLQIADDGQVLGQERAADTSTSARLQLVQDRAVVNQTEGTGTTGLLLSLLALLLLAGGIFHLADSGRLNGPLAKLGIKITDACDTAGQITPGLIRNALHNGTRARAGGGPQLVGTQGVYAGSAFPVSGESSIPIGRDTTNAVALSQDSAVSRRHAQIQSGANGFVLVDTGSSNGTYVNGVRIASLKPQPLRAGDEVQIGMTRFQFVA